MRKAIRDLPANPACSAVYRRDNGDTYGRLNDDYHLKVRIEGDSVIGDGVAEKLDLNEVVEVILVSGD